jgi:uncharacterized membrane protein
VVIGYVFHPISFLMIQIRIADALYPLIAVFGLPALVGLTLGHFLVNLSSPLGWIDLLSVPLFIPAKLAIWKWGLKAVPLHVLSVALWVAYMLHVVFALPFWISVVLVGCGEAVAEIILGIPLAEAVRRRIR